MHVKTITGTVTSPIVLGQGNYGSHLTVASTGTVSTYFETAITDPAGLANARIVNYGNVGATYGGAGIDLAGSGALLNHGHIYGGEGGGANYNGLDGVDLTGSGKIINTGLINGGQGQAGYHGGDGGIGGNGVSLSGVGRLVNSGTILGGIGGGIYDFDGGTGGTGGIGVMIGQADTVINRGVVTGGVGGNGGSYYAGDGGVGVSIANGGILVNDGTISGGAEGPGRNYPNYHGGNAVYLNGGTLIAAAGLIAGGAGGNNSPRGDAVAFGQNASTLQVDPGAAFSGNIVANTNDTLVLAGNTHGTLSGFGKAVTGFGDIEEKAGADWTLKGTFTSTANITLGAGAILSLVGPVSVGTLTFMGGGNADLRLGDPIHVTSPIAGFGTGDIIDLERLQASSFSYANGTLTLFNSNSVAIDAITFDGNYTNTDFALKLVGTSTEILYAGANPLYTTSATSWSNWHEPLQDHLPFF